MKILSFITYPHVVLNLYDLCLSSEHKLRYFFLTLHRQFCLCTKYSCSFIKLRLNHWCHMDNFLMSLLPFCILNVSVALLSMEGQKALGFHQKYLNLCFKDEQRSYWFGTTWGWVINDIIVIFGWTNLLNEKVNKIRNVDLATNIKLK